MRESPSALDLGRIPVLVCRSAPILGEGPEVLPDGRLATTELDRRWCCPTDMCYGECAETGQRGTDR